MTKVALVVYAVVLHVLVIGAGVALLSLPRTHGLDIELVEVGEDDTGGRAALGIDREVSVASGNGDVVAHVLLGDSGQAVGVVLPFADDRGLEMLFSAPVVGGPTIMVRSPVEEVESWFVTDTDADGLPDFRIERSERRRATFRYVVDAIPQSSSETTEDALIRREFNTAGIEKLRFSLPVGGADFDSEVRVEHIADDGTVVRDATITGDEWMNTVWRTLADQADW